MSSVLRQPPPCSLRNASLGDHRQLPSAFDSTIEASICGARLSVFCEFNKICTIWVSLHDMFGIYVSTLRTSGSLIIWFRALTIPEDVSSRRGLIGGRRWRKFITGGLAVAIERCSRSLPMSCYWRSFRIAQYSSAGRTDLTPLPHPGQPDRTQMICVGLRSGLTFRLPMSIES